MKHLQNLLKSLTPQSRRENVLSLRYPNLYNSILDFSKKNLDIPFKQKVYNFLYEVEEIPICKVCSNRVNFYNNKYSTYCSSNCQKSDEDLIIRSVSASKKAFLDKYGVDSYFKLENKHNEIRNSNIEKWGIDNLAKLKSVKDKISKTKKEKTLLKYKEQNINLISINDERIMKIICNDCGETYDINYTTFLLRKKNNVSFCTICNSLENYKTSILEKSLLSFIESFGFKCLSNIRIDGFEIDIFIPDLNLGFEFNGLYWHSEIYKDRMYHINKTKECLKRGISLFHVWEDDWMYRNEIVKSIILNKLGKNTNRLYARNCKVKEIEDNRLVRDFLDRNHMQGFVGAKIKLGIFYQDELVSLMTFGSLRKSLGQTSKEGSYEMLRFCNKLNTGVIGGASKLFKYFITKYDVKEVVSYSDSSRSEGNLYKKLGFNLVHDTGPNYYWIVDGIRKHRFSFRKDKLVKDGADPNKTEIEIMNEWGYYRLFDCGNKKWKFCINKDKL